MNLKRKIIKILFKIQIQFTFLTKLLIDHNFKYIFNIIELYKK